MTDAELTAAVRGHLKTLRKYNVSEIDGMLLPNPVVDGCWTPVGDVAALLTQLEQQHDEEKKTLLARVESMKAGVVGQDLAQSDNEPSPSLPSGRNE